MKETLNCIRVTPLETFSVPLISIGGQFSWLSGGIVRSLGAGAVGGALLPDLFLFLKNFPAGHSQVTWTHLLTQWISLPSNSSWQKMIAYCFMWVLLNLWCNEMKFSKISAIHKVRGNLSKTNLVGWRYLRRTFHFALILHTWFFRMLMPLKIRDQKICLLCSV